MSIPPPPMPPPIVGPSKRLVELDALRGIAAVSVVLFHFTTRFQVEFGHPAPLPLNFPLGHYGVNLFFAISGFVIFMSLEATRHWHDFVASRFSRLFPAFWVAVLITYSVVALRLPDKAVSWVALVANFTMVPGLFNQTVVDGVYWTLQVELFFYGIMLALYLVGLLPRFRWVLAAWLGLRAIWLGASILFGKTLSYSLSAVLILPFLPFFAIGLVAYLVRQDGGRFKPGDVALLVFSIGLALADSLALGIVAACTTAIFVAFVKNKLRFLDHPLLLWFGAISYPLYLLHENIGWATMKGLYEAGLPYFVVLPATMTMVLLMAAGMNRWIELPAMRALRTAYKAWTRRRRRARAPEHPARERSAG